MMAMPQETMIVLAVIPSQALIVASSQILGTVMRANIPPVNQTLGHPASLRLSQEQQVAWSPWDGFLHHLCDVVLIAFAAHLSG